MLEQFSLHIYNKSNWNKCNFAVRPMSYNIVHILYICFMQVLARRKYQCYLISSISHSYAINRYQINKRQTLFNSWTILLWNSEICASTVKNSISLIFSKIIISYTLTYFFIFCVFYLFYCLQFYCTISMLTLFFLYLLFFQFYKATINKSCA